MIVCSRLLFFFFKQKTAYEMRISDWSSDVCSSDLSKCASAKIAPRTEECFMSVNALVANNLPIPSALGSLDAYIGAVNRIPVLTAEQEQSLARRFRDEEDLDAAKQLVLRSEEHTSELQ